MNNGLLVGLFADNKIAIEKFASNVYMNYLYAETIEELMEAERELDIAKKIEATESDIKGLEQRIKFLESVVSLATQNYESFQQEEEQVDSSHKSHD